MNTLPELKTAWLQAKHDEQAANSRRIAIEQLILQDMPKKDEGTVNQDGITVSYKLNRSVDTEALQTAWATLPANAQKAFKWAASLDTKHYRALIEVGAPEYQAIAPYITSKAAKPSIEIKE